MRRRFTLLVLSTAGLAGCAGGATVMPPLAPAEAEPDPAASGGLDTIRPQVTEVAFHAGELWMRGTDGTLVAVDPDTGAAQRRLRHEWVVDMHRTLDDRLWLLTVAPDTDDVHVWRRTVSGYEPILEMSAPGSALLGLTDFRGRPLVLSEHAVFWAADGVLLSKAFDGKLRRKRFEQLHIAATDEGSVYVGWDSGKDAGALWQIALSTGQMRLLRRVDERLECAGPLNPECDPITGVVPDPTAAGCVIASVGNLWQSRHGELVRVCGARVTEIAGPWSRESHVSGGLEAMIRAFAPERPELDDDDDWTLADICRIEPEACPKLDLDKEAAPPRSPRARPFDYERLSSEPILGLNRGRLGVWIATRDVLYYLGRGGVEQIETAQYARVGHGAIGRLPGALVVATEADARGNIVSGFTDLVAVRDLSFSPKTPAAVDSPPFGVCYAFEEWMSWYGRRWLWCIDRDRYFFRDSRGWTSALVSWESLPDGTFRAVPLAAEEVRFRFYPTHAQVLTRASGSFRVSEKLEPLTRAELAGAWRDIRSLPSVEPACERARRCARSTQAARAQLEAAPSGDVPRDLGNCVRLISENLNALRKSREPKHDSVRTALAACTR